jgi:hypothetical protein
MKHDNIYVIQKIHPQDAKIKRQYLIGAIGMFEDVHESVLGNGYLAGTFKTISGEDDCEHYFLAIKARKIK